jgi:hypothetical protein
MGKENHFDNINQELNQVDKELKNLGQIEKTFNEFLCISVDELLRKKVLEKNHGHIQLNRTGGIFCISFEIKNSKVYGKEFFAPIAHGNLSLKQISFAVFEDPSINLIPWYLNEEIIPFLGDTFQKCGFSIGPKELREEIDKRKQV